MRAKLREIIDHYEITNLIGQYCRGIDRMDAELMASVYAQHSWDDHGSVKASGPEFVSHVIGLMKAGASVLGTHMLGQTLVKITGDEAGAETYFLASSRKRLENGKEVLNQLAGRYIDTLVREDGCWKIKHRVCTRDWSISLPIDMDWMAGEDFEPGRRSGEDASFKVLGTTHSGDSIAT